MYRKIPLWLFATLMALAGGFAYADTKVVDGITWNYTISNGKAIVQGEESWIPAIDCDFEGSITIPSELGGCPVTVIGSRAFERCAITSVTIPDSVTGIAQYAFWFCPKLSSVTIPSSVQFIGWGAFGCCEALKSVTLQPGVAHIEGQAFRGCTSLESISLPSSITYVGDLAFFECENIKDITLPASMLPLDWDSFASSKQSITNIVVCDGGKNIPRSSFAYCRKLKTITLPESVTNIGEVAFVNCSGLERITIPSKVRNIDRKAFEDCSALSSIRILSDEITIRANAFSGCSSLGSGVVIADGCLLCVNSGCPANVRIPEGTRTIAEGAFKSNSVLTTVTIPSTVKEISNEAFRECSRLTEITISEGVEGIGNLAFFKCAKLRSVTIPSTIKNWGYGGFECTGVKSAVISDGVTEIGATSFYCSDLAQITIPSSVTNIGNGAFLGGNNLGNGVVIVDGCVLCVNGTCPNSVILPSETRLLAEGAFNNCTGLKSITIPAGVGHISEDCFEGCSNLTTVNIPEGIKSVDEGAFMNCTALASIDIPSSVANIGGAAFAGCGALQSIKLPDELESIGNSLFSGCTNLVSIAIPDRVLSIGDHAFYRCSELSSPITIPSGVKHIGSEAFYGCQKLTAVTLQDGVESIGGGAFSHCSSLKSLSIPSTVTNICSGFYGCSALGDGVVIVDDCVLTVNGDCPSWVALPEGTRLIAGSAFSLSLTEIKIPKSVTSIGECAFESSTTNVFMLGSPAMYNRIYACCTSNLTTYVTDEWKYDKEMWEGHAVQVLSVDMSPSGVTPLNGTAKLVMQSPLPNSVIRYTIDGSDPTTDSPAFTRALGVSSVMTVKAAIEYGGTIVSGISETRFVLGVVDPPVITAYDYQNRKVEEDGFYKEARVSISCGESGAKIYYSVDGSDFVEYKNEFKINRTASIKAYAQKDDYGDSEIIEMALTRMWKQVELPVIDTAAHFDETNGQFVIICPTVGATIRYEFSDGFLTVDDPTGESAVYTKPVKTYKGGVLKARAFGDDPEIWLPSEVATAKTMKWTGIPTTLDAPELVFETGGDAKWISDFVKSEYHAGWDSMHSGLIGASQKSWIQTNVNGPGEFSFWWMTDCEGPANGAWDHLALYVDDLSNAYMVRDGSNAWAKCTLKLGAGNHCIRWSYEKDSDAWGDGRDCGWIDHLVWIPDDGSGYTKAFPIPVEYSWLKKYGLLDKGLLIR